MTIRWDLYPQGSAPTTREALDAALGTQYSGLNLLPADVLAELLKHPDVLARSIRERGNIAYGFNPENNSAFSIDSEGGFQGWAYQGAYWDAELGLMLDPSLYLEVDDSRNLATMLDPLGSMFRDAIETGNWDDPLGSEKSAWDVLGAGMEGQIGIAPSADNPDARAAGRTFGTIMAGGAIANAFSGAAGVAAGSGTATVQGAELAMMVEAGTVGVEGAFLEAAALSGSAVTFSTSTGALLSAVTPAGETVLFDAAIDPYTQFGDMPIDNVKLPQESSELPKQTQQSPQLQQPQQAAQSSNFTKSLTSYGQKLLASEAMKLLISGNKSPGESASAAAQRQGVAPGQNSGDITPLVALAMIAGAFVVRKKR